MNCDHAKTVTSDLRSQGVNAKVTLCSACGATVDYRNLREPDATGPSGLPDEEREIQARAKIAKAEEVGLHGLAEKLREESGEMDALPMNIKQVIDGSPRGESGRVAVIEMPDDARVEATLKAKRALLVGVDCSQRADDTPACDTGDRQAHNCRHSKWGKLRTFTGPCRCACHSSSKQEIPT